LDSHYIVHRKMFLLESNCRPPPTAFDRVPHLDFEVLGDAVNLQTRSPLSARSRLGQEQKANLLGHLFHGAANARRQGVALVKTRGDLRPVQILFLVATAS
jgi:hypothetical protein